MAVGFSDEKIGILVAVLINLIDNVRLKTHLIKPDDWLLIVCIIVCYSLFDTVTK